VRLSAGMMVLASLAAGASGHDEGDGRFATMEDDAKRAAVNAASVAKATAEEDQWEKTFPATFSIDYTLVSDYIWRGINLSEYDGERGQRLNHQLGVGVSHDAGDLGEFSGSIWLEWFEGQQAMDPASGGKLQEVDYTLSWGYDLSKLNKKIPLNVEVGLIGYHFPQAAGGGQFTWEYYVGVEVDDSKLFGTDAAVLTPTVTYYQDCNDFPGSWLEFGISHEFALAACGMADFPVLKNITVTPSFTLGADLGYMSDSSRVAHVQYGLDVTYDLSRGLKIPEQYGSFSINGFVNFSDAVWDEGIDDEFWGGVTLGWEW